MRLLVGLKTRVLGAAMICCSCEIRRLHYDALVEELIVSVACGQQVLGHRWVEDAETQHDDMPCKMEKENRQNSNGSG